MYLCRSVLSMVGQAEVDIASQSADYEINLSQDVVTVLTNMLEVKYVCHTAMSCDICYVIIDVM